MILLPRGNPVKEKIDPSKVNLAEALKKLKGGGFTGYLRFETGEGTGIVIFEKGRLISALFEGKERLVAYDALARIFSASLATRSTLDIYRLSADLAMSVHALLHGDVLYKGQELKLLDIRTLLGKLKEDQINGCLRIYTTDRIALIFYRAGNAVGFFHDGSTEIETTADTSMSVAKLPGAKIDVLTTKSNEELMLADLMETADISELWQRSQTELARQKQQQVDDTARTKKAEAGAQKEKILEMLRKTAEQHVGKIGSSLVEKEFAKVAGAGVLSEGSLELFFVSLAKAAKLVAGPTKVGEMEKEMRRLLKALM